MLLLPLLLQACVSAHPEPAAVPGVTAQVEPDGIRLVERSMPVLFYRSRPEPEREDWRVHFVHPLWSPGGAVITEDAPADHVHHRGVFWAWRRVLVDDQQVADGWVGKDLRVELSQPVARTLADGSAEIVVNGIWTVPLQGQATPIVAEKTRIRAYPLGPEGRRVEFAVELQALREGVALGGTDDEKGYGGFSLRLGYADRVRIESDGQNVAAQVGPVGTGPAVTFRWDLPETGWPERVEVSCAVDGAAWRSWILRQELSMQNCAFPGRSVAALPTDRPVGIHVSITVR